MRATYFNFNLFGLLLSVFFALDAGALASPRNGGFEKALYSAACGNEILRAPRSEAEKPALLSAFRNSDSFCADDFCGDIADEFFFISRAIPHASIIEISASSDFNMPFSKLEFSDVPLLI